ncbi:MAG: hypothetical protein WAK94_15440 [Steroidobacteraceae bacterium]
MCSNDGFGYLNNIITFSPYLKHFEPWLGPLKEARRDAFGPYGDEDSSYETWSQRSLPVR